ncbi:hypothetical protein A2801_03530 [Candidatus Woesebacteria bacterium RIFCSPHIGHO2_01_FULL_41_10]|uniref:FAD-binding FR-type domain-containing protein n=1 Tax=Candidatus Woesebacteria bacterium RIFCSPHIGHO2_01_FULL_41_10 TaxID=1802500 RepID=A0A1F7YPA6_9BACT|nr:MAG: hypothetical protein A2801_03530 [Candidatus Woesebacteria bacterium RIFCSPHIGHO2_01_FULL_41_10]
METHGRSSATPMTEWQPATLIETYKIASDVASLTFRLQEWTAHVPGQHYSIKLTSPNGYSAQRDYSVASSPEQGGKVEFGVKYLEGGEVSPYLHTMKIGQQVELRGPLGGHFTWNTSMQGPLVLVGGGTGVVPLVSMIRHLMRHIDTESTREVILLGSFKSVDYILYHDELEDYAQKHKNFKLIFTLTRETPPWWNGYRSRINRDILKEVFGHLKDQSPLSYVCGPTAFVESVASGLVSLGFDTLSIKTERFG